MEARRLRPVLNPRPVQRVMDARWFSKLGKGLQYN